jgi:hypothetical protein
LKKYFGEIFLGCTVLARRDSLCLRGAAKSTGGGAFLSRGERCENRRQPIIHATHGGLAFANSSPTFQFVSLFFSTRPCYSTGVAMEVVFQGASTMEWVTPQHEEVDLNCEISSYANAEL